MFGEGPFGTANDATDGHNGNMEIEMLKERSAEAAARDERVLELKARLGTSISACIVGGAVRDFALGRVPHEIDLVVEEDAGEVARVCAGSDVTVHERFMTASLTLPSGSVDVATAREETYSAPGALPDVLPGTFELDRIRRDFTVNALRISLSDLKPVADPVGWDDLSNGILRVLHSGSFIDDPTRLWRLARYSGRLGFDVEKSTLELAQDAVRAGAMGTVSPSRIGSELLRTISGSEPDSAILAAASLGLLGDGFASEQLEKDLDSLRSRAIKPVSLPALRLAGVTWGGASSLKGMLVDLGLGDELTRVAVEAERSEQLASELASAERPSEVDRVCSRWHQSVILLAGIRLRNERALTWIEAYSRRVLPFTGTDLIAEGIEQGPEVGVALAAARAAMLDLDTDDRSVLIDAALSSVRGNVDQGN